MFDYDKSHACLDKFNLQRELKLMKDILILVSILLFAGLPYSVMVFWHATKTHSAIILILSR